MNLFQTLANARVPSNNGVRCAARQGVACRMFCVTDSDESWKLPSRESYKNAVIRMQALVWSSLPGSECTVYR